MLLLAIETSSARGSLALFSDGGLVAEAVFPEGLVHGREITVHLRDLLAARGLAPASLQAIAVGVGPGSYTGIRVGVTAAKTLAFALQIPVIAESSMRVIAAGAASLAGADTAPSGGGLPVVVAIDGRQGQVYMSRHRVRVRSGPGGAAAGGAPLLEPEAAERVVELPRTGSRTARGGEAVPPLPPAIPEAVRDELRRMVEPGVVVLGDAAEAILRAAGVEGAVRGPSSLDWPRAAVLGALAAARCAASPPRFDLEAVHSLSPVYLRPTEAERKLARG